MTKNILATLCALFLLPTAAYADVVGCTGQVQAVELRSNGLVIGDWGYGWKGLCYLHQDTNVNGIYTVKDTCGSFYAAMLTSEANHQQIVSYHAASTCSSAMAETSASEHWMAVPPYSLVIRAN